MNPRHPMVSRRARQRCEYCLAPEFVLNFPFEVEHIVPSSRHGPDDESNLALACRACNLRKRDRTAVRDDETGGETPIFNPRADRWHDHFTLDLENGLILPVTDVGRATVILLDLNDPFQVAARLVWIELRLYP